jgi:hypothetical protein
MRKLPDLDRMTTVRLAFVLGSLGVIVGGIAVSMGSGSGLTAAVLLLTTALVLVPRTLTQRLIVSGAIAAFMGVGFWVASRAYDGWMPMPEMPEAPSTAGQTVLSIACLIGSATCFGIAIQRSRRR